MREARYMFEYPPLLRPRASGEICLSEHRNLRNVAAYIIDGMPSTETPTGL